MVSLPPFQALLDEHGDGVWRFLRASVGEHDAADCFQETMISALRSYPGLERATNLKGWLFTIAHHKAVDHHRRRTRRRETGAEPPEGAIAPSEPAEPPDRALWRAVDALPPKQRIAVLQRYVADLPYATIAEILGGSEAAARQNVRAGLLALRKEVHR